MQTNHQTSPRSARQRFAEHLSKFYWKPLFWHGAYFVASVGGATLETVKAYVQSQGTEAHLQKKHNSRFSKLPSLDPTLLCGKGGECALICSNQTHPISATL